MLPKWLSELSGEFEHDESVVDAAILAHLTPPRSPDVLFEKLYALGVGTDDLVVDVGCGYGNQALEIATKTGCRLLAFDQSPQCVAESRSLARENDASRLHVARAAAEALPVRDGSTAAVWSRDMLYYVDLRVAFSQFARALRPGGHAIVYMTFATELMEPNEAARLYSAASLPENRDPAHFERCALEAGFEISERDVISSEWRELGETGDPRVTADKLLRAARMLRGGEPLRRAMGEQMYDDHLSDSLWGIFQMLHKLRPTIYVLRRD
jgi:SAM-dependent methyltransferase